MEMSSPLAAMHPPQLPVNWGLRRDVQTRRPMFAHLNGKNFNFRDLSMKTDYFNLPPMRGSSPTTSLAADMSSNLHMDQSPQLATPRRSLFTTNIFQQADNRAAGTTTPPIRWEGVTTPPIPSSSPYVHDDSMDISPLPHKAPYSFVTELTAPSPSPAIANANATSDEDMISPCEQAPPPQFPVTLPSQAPVQRPVSAAGVRRKSALTRPSFLRAKHNSTNSVTAKSREVPDCPPFRFGSGADTSVSIMGASLDDCFAASPQQERRPSSNPLQPFSRAKPPVFGAMRGNGSPHGVLPRKLSNPMRRPNKVRRSLSMYENPCDVMNAKQETDTYTPSGLQSVMDVDDAPAPTLKLPHFIPNAEPDSLPRITGETLVDVLNGKYDDQFSDRMIIDCRFEYEYEGGHVVGAKNYCGKEELASVLFDKPSDNRLIILHCEYSAHRAPLMAKFVRQEDRRFNCHRYPHLTYPEVYILDGGYSSFYASFRNRCEPQDYTQMDAPKHEASCERGMNKLRQRSKLNRAQTFAYGMQSCQVEESPTAAGRSRSGGVLTLGGTDDDLFPQLDKPLTTRRLASWQSA